MEAKIWTNPQEKFVDIMVLRGEFVHTIRVTGLMLKRKAQGILEQLQQGADPTQAGGKPRSMPVGAIVKAEVSPSKGSLKLHGQDGATLKFNTPNSDADGILTAILERGGRTFSPSQEAIGVVEAALPPAILGLIGGLFWMGLYDTVKKHAVGQEVEVSGRRQGMQKLMIWGADLLGYNGVVAIGAVLGALLLGWLVTRLVKRPLRTVWLPVTA